MKRKENTNRVFKPLVISKDKKARKLGLDELKGRKLQRLKDSLIKAIKYHNGETDKVISFVAKWRNVCESASNFLLNSMQLKIMKMGGYDVWRSIQSSRKDKILQQVEDYRSEEISKIAESDDFANLSAQEQSEIMDQVTDYSRVTEDTEHDIELTESIGQLSMKELYSMLNIDYELVYGRAPARILD